jgi:16S rRNA (adenine1518-N6/adenine1519-N6)-dimethyltransferase
VGKQGLVVGQRMSYGPKPKKQLGQHWLHDEIVLQAIVADADVRAGDTVLEIGPGLGTLTKEILATGANVIAVEFDHDLATTLAERIGRPERLTVHEQDILDYDFSLLPAKYVVIANIPYYLTSNLIRKLGEASNPPRIAVILIQKEVAERVCAAPGDMSLLSVSAQIFFEAHLSTFVPAELFTPPPKVDSQVLVLQRRPQPLVDAAQQKDFFRLVKAGFAERRKKLRGSLSGGLHISKTEADELLKSAQIDPDLRAQALSIDDWIRLFNVRAQD